MTPGGETGAPGTAGAVAGATAGGPAADGSPDPWHGANPLAPSFATTRTRSCATCANTRR